jgi:hypothetical protein
VELQAVELQAEELAAEQVLEEDFSVVGGRTAHENPRC